MASPKTFPCPKCGRSLKSSGELTVGDAVFPTFDCDECIMTVDVAGEPMELPLTFAVNSSGQPFDPADPDGRLRLDG